MIDDPALWWFEGLFCAIYQDFENAVSCATKAYQKGYSDQKAYQLILDLFKQNNASSENTKAIEDIIDNMNGMAPTFIPNG